MASNIALKQLPCILTRTKVKRSDAVKIRLAFVLSFPTLDYIITFVITIP